MAVTSGAPLRGESASPSSLASPANMQQQLFASEQALELQRRALQLSFSSLVPAHHQQQTLQQRLSSQDTNSQVDMARQQQLPGQPLHLSLAGLTAFPSLDSTSNTISALLAEATTRRVLQQQLQQQAAQQAALTSTLLGGVQTQNPAASNRTQLPRLSSHQPALTPFQLSSNEKPVQETTTQFIQRLASASRMNGAPQPSSFLQAPSIEKGTTAEAQSKAAASTHVSSQSLRGVDICALQPHGRKPGDSPLDATQRILKHMDDIASKETVDLFVLPQLSPVGYSEDTFRNYLPRTPAMQSMYHQIGFAFASKACKLQVFISYGTIGWRPRADGTLSFFIRQVVLDRSGQVVSSYDKVHLKDYGNSAETRYFERGSTECATVFTINGLRFGTLLCADMRYPNLCRNLVRDQLVDVLLQPAAFSRDDSSFRTWKSFRETRAVENSVYFVGVNYAGESYGETSFVPPWVDDEHVPLVLRKKEAYLMGKVERNVLHHVRSAMPFYRHLMHEEGTRCCTIPKDGDSLTIAAEKRS
jgi:predicted amidohydrolase